MQVSERRVAALTALAEAGVPVDVQEFLLKNDALDKALDAALSAAEPVEWQRRAGECGWQRVNDEDLPHYREKGAELRALYDRPPQPAPSVGVKALTLDALKQYFASLDAGDIGWSDMPTALYTYLLMDGYISEDGARQTVRTGAGRGGTQTAAGAGEFTPRMKTGSAMTDIKPVAWTSKKGLRHLARTGFLYVGKNEDRERNMHLYGPEAADEITRLRQLLSEADKREREARAKALEEAAAYHDAKVREYTDQIAVNDAYLARGGRLSHESRANEYCDDMRSCHRRSAEHLRSMAGRAALERSEG